ncbi:dystrobrevin beta-like isoform X3 [Homarus americanus]|uniref:dystrobrevin beta-like isoform X3 n=1 Tax=Homarus americanus TaxID=6706 RepID=UPI001C4810B4|nr:dystrobrevin beta-like isoform X3 [Homarus americanus]
MWRRPTHDQKTVVIHLHKMFSSRRKSLPDPSTISTTTTNRTSKRRASNGFLNPEVMAVPGEGGPAGMGGGGVSGGLGDGRLLVADLRHHNFDAIRFASYRTAAKLRFVQKKTNMHRVDIWNIIEAFRENGLNTLEPYTEVKVSRLETLISTLYHSLNKRLPVGQHVVIESSTSILLNWLLSAYDNVLNCFRDDEGKLRVFSVKVALATLCSSKPLDKLRYIFSQISDGNGHLSLTRFSEYLKEVLALPAAVFESPSFSYSENLVTHIFDGIKQINVNDFLEVVLEDPGPECLAWLPLLHRLAASESDALWAVELIDDDYVDEFIHQTMCDGCRRENFSGLRYKCEKCHNYSMCQECFWLGRFSPPHSIHHQVKEYTSFTPTRHSFRRSLRCVPDRPSVDRPRFPELPEKTLNLSHIVPPSPLPTHNGFEGGGATAPLPASLESRSSSRSCISSLPDWSQLDEEHRLIAHYAARLANQTSHSGSESVDSSPGFDASSAQRDLIQSLEAKNRDIMREINALRRQQERVEGSSNPTLVAELRALRSHRHELESNLSYLQDSRKQLMQQLESLMKMLKNHQTSPTTPNGSPKSPPFSTSGTLGSSVMSNLPSGTQGSTASSRSAPPTPSHTAQVSTLDSLSSLHVDGLQSAVSSVFSSAGSNCTPDNSPDDSLASRSLRNDLLVAADSVTNAMSSLVRELNSESSDDDSLLTRPLPDRDYDFKGLYESPAWRSMTHGTYSEDEGPLTHLHIRKSSGDVPLSNTQAGMMGNNKWHNSLGGNEQDDNVSRKESNTPDWEEAGMGWVNR